MERKFYICEAKELPIGSRLRFSTAEINVIVVNHNEKLVAFDQRCPHKGAKMDNAVISDNNIVCTSHNYVFDRESGYCLNRTCPALKIYNVVIERSSLFLVMSSFIDV